MHDTVIAVSLLLVVLLTMGCKEKKHVVTPQEAAINYVKMIDQGNIDEAILHTNGCDSTTTDYNRRLALLYKQMAANAHKEFGKLRDVKVISTDRNKEQNYADVYLRLTYNNDSSRNVLLQLVYVKGAWFLK